MATLKMDVYRYTNGTSDKVWAICIDGQRVIVYYGKTGQETLRGGPVKMKQRGTRDEMEHRVNEQLKQGYQSIGKQLVEDKRLTGNTPSDGTAFAKPLNLSPTLAALCPKEKVAQIIERLTAGLDVKEFANSVEITLPDGRIMSWSTTGSEVRMVAKQEDGSFGLLVVLAAADAVGATAYDDNEEAQTKIWLTSSPALFSDIPNLRDIAVDLQLLSPPIKVKEQSKRIVLW